jgi:glutaryl-CoA dehydrogenase (non-decarboxylating)
VTELTAAQREKLEEYGAFVDEQIVPLADRMDAEEATPPAIVAALAARGYLGALVPEEHGGRAVDLVTYGLLSHELARGSASLLSLLTVHSMVCVALLKWGSDEQRSRWLPRLARGEALGAFALSEPNVGSDAGNPETSAAADGRSYVLRGRKKWISYAQSADVYLVVAHCDGKPTVFLVERRTPGLECRPIRGMLGFRAAMLGELILDECRVPAENIVGRVGFGFSHVIGTALDTGRYSIAWGCTGLSQECLSLSLSYSESRKQGGAYLRDHQLIQRMVADMITDVRAARQLCLRAGVLRDAGDPDSILETSIAKYFASRTATRVANDAVQIHGAHGCGPDSPVQRHFRDARIMEIIEGSTQIQQIIIARSGYQSHVSRWGR